MNILDAYRKYSKETTYSEKVRSTKSFVEVDELNSELLKFPKTIKYFYSIMDSLRSDWETIEPVADGKTIYGRINILPSEKVLRDWKGVVYFEGEEDSEISRFKIVDFFCR